ncbi:MAG: DEAD/DEAH box helicase [Methylococcales bacterium]
MSFDLLSPPIRKYIREQRWEQLRDIQVAAIHRILTTDNHYILASPTSSGKTEAAFLPILSTVDFKESGVQVLYISPLIALINDQFYRIELLCQSLDITVTKWHGEAKLSAKNKLIKEPSGIVLITPESLEAMFVNKPFNIKLLFSNLKFVVIDEIHAFIGTDRGIQLKSLLSRLQLVNTTPFRIIGLSATIGDYSEAKKFTGNEEKTKVLLDKRKKELCVEFKYFKSDSRDLPLKLLKDLYLNTRNDKVLIFPNSRGRTEEIAVKLKKISDKVNGHGNYFTHHSSVDKEIREDIEFFAKNNKYKNFTIACTSTLELGIDIGSVNKVIQIDATHSVASLIQRIGRSGRRGNENSHLILYATNEYSLLQSLACWLLYNEDSIDSPYNVDKPFDILVHQILSITKQYSGLPMAKLIDLVGNNFAFSYIEKSDCEEIISHLINTELLERIQHEVIIGLEGEKLINTWDFYGVFKTKDNFKVVNSGNKIGEIPFSPQLVEDENIFLAAKIWKIKFIDFKYKKIEVISANDGKSPIFISDEAIIHPKIRQKMLDVLYSKEHFYFLDAESHFKLDELRRDFSVFNIQDYLCDRPLLIKEGHLEFFSFTGTRINRSISFLFDIAKIEHFSGDGISFEIKLSKQDLLAKWYTLVNLIDTIDVHLETLLKKKPEVIGFSKWGQYLPLKFQINLLKQHYFDFNGAELFLTSCKLIASE